MTHASRDTTTGARFEERAHAIANGIDLTKNKLYKYLEKNHINWNKIISRKLLVLLMKEFKLVALKLDNIKNWEKLWARMK